MKRHLSRAIAIVAIGLAAAVVPAGVANASTAAVSAPTTADSAPTDAAAGRKTHGYYWDQGYCNYLRHGVQAGGRRVSPCRDAHPPGTTCPGGCEPRPSWYFYSWPR